METVGGTVDVDTVDEVRVRVVGEVVVTVVVEEDMVVGTCNKTSVVTTAMVDQGHCQCLLKPGVSKYTPTLLFIPVVYFPVCLKNLRHN